MSYNWKCCSFYPNNFDASALTTTEVRMYPDRGTHVSRPRYTCTPTVVRSLQSLFCMTLKPVSFCDIRVAI